MSNANQINRYACGLDIVPGLNEDLDADLVKQAIRETEGCGPEGGFRARMDAGIYEVRRPQMAVKRRG
jgi:hypothetical protein